MAAKSPPRKRDAWTSRMGVIFAVAGSAIGLGNLLVFPGLAAQNGGGAFLIPYFIALLLLGIPLCWVEWTMGRYAGRFHYGSAPGIFHAMWKWPGAKYLGVIGVIGPLTIFFWYAYVEAWTLGYAYNAVLSKFQTMSSKEEFGAFLDKFITWAAAAEPGGEKPSIIPQAYWFFLITFFANFVIIYFGVSRGIEKVSKFALPLLAIMGVVLTVRVLTLGTPDAATPDYNVINGLGFVWNPAFDKLKEPGVWLAAAGQVFFTLSVGIGTILTYASYIRKKEDLALSSLTACSVNTFFEVIIGGSVVVVAACAFFGAAATQEVAGSPFSLGFVTMPHIFNFMQGGVFFSVMWFLLIFFAGLTSSISILQPAISFMEDEFGTTRKQSVVLIGVVCFGMAHFAIIPNGMLGIDELYFWGGRLGLVIFGLIEVLLFGWIFGIDKGFKELHHGAAIRIPRLFKFIIKYVTPTYIILMLTLWFCDTEKGFLPTILMKTYKEEQRPAVLAIRIALLVLVVFFCALIYIAFKRQGERKEEKE